MMHPLLLAVATALLASRSSGVTALGLAGELRTLAELHGAGGLSAAEFSQAKQRLLAEPPPPAPRGADRCLLRTTMFSIEYSFIHTD